MQLTCKKVITFTLLCNCFSDLLIYDEIWNLKTFKSFLGFRKDKLNCSLNMTAFFTIGAVNKHIKKPRTVLQNHFHNIMIAIYFWNTCKNYLQKRL